MNLIHKKIISTKLTDARWLEGESIEDSFESSYAFGDVLELYFKDETYVRIQTVPTPEGKTILGVKTGTWRTNDNNEIEILT